MRAEKSYKEEIEEMLQTLVENDPDILGCILVRQDGLPLGSYLSETVDKRIFSAMAAAILNIGLRSINELGGGDLQYITVVGTKGNLILMGTGEESNAVLVSLVKPKANIGLVLVEMERAAQKISGILKAI
ncbi:MAG: roadblock/LC7 domain-containing protein [Candidatus Njordarchaeum guaymaensis]